MSAAVPAAPSAAAPRDAAGAAASPNRRAWGRFKRNRLGYGSLWIFCALLALSACAELLSNDRPLVACYQGVWSFPVFDNPSETAYGGDFHTPTDWTDPA